MASLRRVTCALLLCSVNFLAACGSQSALIKNITLALSVHFRIDCLIIYRRLDEPSRHFDAFKALSSDLRFPVGVYTFDERRMGKGCPLPLNVIIGEGLKGEFAGFSNKHSMADEIWVIFLNTSATDFFEESRPPFDSEVVAAEILSPQEILFKEIYTVDHGYPLRIVNYGKWTEENGLDLDKLPLHDRRSDLEGKVMRVGSTENWPISSFRNGGWDGIMPRLWREIEGLINCTTVPVRSVDGATGMELNNGTWSGLVGMLLSDNIDVIAAQLTVTKTRMNVLRFSFPAARARRQIFFKALGYKLEWKAVFKPLAFSTWLALCGWTVVGSLCISWAYNCYSKLGREECEKIHFSRAESFFFILQSLCQQGYPVVPRSLSCRIIFVTAYALSTIMIPSYSASLISSLTHRTPIKPFDSLEEMVAEGQYKLLVKRNTAAYTEFSNSTSPLYQEIYRKYIDEKYKNVEIDNTIKVLDEIVCREKNYALFGVDLVIDIEMEQRKPKCSIISMGQPLDHVFISLGVRKDSPYSRIIDSKLQKLQDIGSVQRLRTSIRQLHSVSSKEMLFRQVEVGEIFQVFLLLTLGIIISVFVFMTEFVASKINIRRKWIAPRGR